MPPQNLPSRPRRNRRSPTIRAAMCETHLSPANFILPLFVHDGDADIPIGTMPGCSRLGWKNGLLRAVKEARAEGVNRCVGGRSEGCRWGHSSAVFWVARPSQRSRVTAATRNSA